jgi:hypothetical protein
MIRLVSSKRSWHKSYSQVFTTVSSLISAAVLAGCVESTASPPPQAQAQAPQALARRDGVSPRGASVALASLTGVSQPVADRIKTAFAQEASDREISLADAKDADYFVRGYINASASELGTAVTVVFDIFNVAKKRMQRLEDDVFVEGAAADPWSVVDTAAIDKLATKSAEGLAAFLTNTPEAIAKSQTDSAPVEGYVSTQAKSDANQTIVKKAQPMSPPSSAKTADLSIAALR